jgi:hypothetical protein
MSRMVVWALPPGQDEYESGRENGESRCWNENWETSCVDASSNGHERSVSTLRPMR